MNNEIFSIHQIFPLIALMPLHLDLHLFSLFGQIHGYMEGGKIPVDERRVLGAIMAKKPTWPRQGDVSTNMDRVLSDLVQLIRNYRAEIENNASDLESPCDESCRGWSREYPYPIVQKIPETLKTNPSAYHVFSHQEEWLLALRDRGDVYDPLRIILTSALQRFFSVRDLIEIKETPEIRTFDLSDHKLFRYCDYLMETIESICLKMGRAWGDIQANIDFGQGQIQNGILILDDLNKTGDTHRFELFAPYLANMSAFLEAVDKVVQWMTQMKKQDIEFLLSQISVHITIRGAFRNWERRSGSPSISKRDFPSKEDLDAFACYLQKVKGEAGQKLFGNQWLRLWNPAADMVSPRTSILSCLGPRLLKDLYYRKLTHLWRSFDFGEAYGQFRKLQNVEKIAALTKDSLPKQWSSEKDKPGEKTSRRRFRSLMISPPFILNISLGVSLLILGAMDYDLWTKISTFSVRKFFIEFLLLLGGWIGTFSLIKGESGLMRRIARATLLFVALALSSSIPSFFGWILFPDFFLYSGWALLFLMAGGIFFAVVIQAIGISPPKRD